MSVIYTLHNKRQLCEHDSNFLMPTWRLGRRTAVSCDPSELQGLTRWRETCGTGCGSSPLGSDTAVAWRTCSPPGSLASNETRAQVTFNMLELLSHVTKVGDLVNCCWIITKDAADQALTCREGCET